MSSQEDLLDKIEEAERRYRIDKTLLIIALATFFVGMGMFGTSVVLSSVLPAIPAFFVLGGAGVLLAFGTGFWAAWVWSEIDGKRGSAKALFDARKAHQRWVMRQG